MMTRMMTDSGEKPEEEVPAAVAASDTLSSKDVSRNVSKCSVEVKRTTRPQCRHLKTERGEGEVSAHDLQRVQRVYDQHPVAFQRWLQESAPEEVCSWLASARPSTLQENEPTSSLASGKDLFQQWMASAPNRVSQSAT